AAAAPLHRPLARGRAGGPVDGRAMLGARPHVDVPDRADDQRARERGHDRDRHAQHAAGAARLPPVRVLPRRRERAGPDRGDRIDGDHLRPSLGPEDRRLRQREVRLRLRTSRPRRGAAHRFVVGGLAFAIVAAAALLPGVANAGSSPTIYGAGSTWSQIALDQWRVDVARTLGLSVNYQG